MGSLIQFTDAGIYCPKGDFYVDPWKPVSKAIITHAHADHARPHHKNYLAHYFSGPIMKHRLGEGISLETIDYNQVVQMNGVKISLHPAGHIPGSAQIRIEYKGQICVISGDYKLENDGMSDPFDPIKCHEFVTESTFGLPIYRWHDQQSLYQEINNWWKNNKAQGKTSVIFAYALGKAQRILKNIDHSIGKVYTHAAVENMNEVLRNSGIALPESIRVTNEIPKSAFIGNLVIATPASIGSPWMRKFTPYSTGIASGWMMLRGTRRRKAADRGFVLSDHADWNGLIQAVEATGAEKIYATHGYSDVFSKFLQEKGLDAKRVESSFEGESLDKEL
ncbi:ligase-associated DNA damage response exonuclease [Marivirga sp. S37H4]|uniref:Ligase-associated DNA damage response exonuclease n=1 Tax=Marivirga aurantiaca TaxID=2802615 RepID=A0A934WW94_9BACT|nr:ligase-associated DNA damage response exonuclease [Marivirga aurantiaca]MBK6264122.1 ligase-associated DNA damage response exonuclease [Marivirga aurantiaca]